MWNGRFFCQIEDSHTETEYNWTKNSTFNAKEIHTAGDWQTREVFMATTDKKKYSLPVFC